MRLNALSILIITTLLWALAFYPSIWSTIQIWERSETFTHGFLIAPICIYLIRERWHLIQSAPIKPALIALIPIAGFLGLWIIGSLGQIAVAEQFAAFALLPLLIWLMLGNAASRPMLFAMLFWMFSVPAGEFLIPQLQEVTADFTVFFLKLTGIPTYREGLFIAIPGGLFEVAVACSGIRYLIASFCLGTLYAYLNYTSSKKRIWFILFSLALPILANGIRAYGIVMIAHLSDMKYATGVDHLIYGWLWFGVVLFIMFAIGNIWRDPVPKRPDSSEITTRNVSPATLTKAAGGLIVLLAVALGYKINAASPTLPAQPDFGPLISQEKALGNWQPVFPHGEIVKTGEYQGSDIFIAYYSTNSAEQELISSINHPYNIQSWTIINRDTYANYRLLEVNNAAGQRRYIAYSYVADDLLSPVEIKVKLYQTLQAILGQPQQAAFVAISAPANALNNDRDDIKAKADAFFTPALQALLDDK